MFQKKKLNFYNLHHTTCGKEKKPNYDRSINFKGLSIHHVNFYKSYGKLHHNVIQGTKNFKKIYIIVLLTSMHRLKLIISNNQLMLHMMFLQYKSIVEER